MSQATDEAYSYLRMLGVHPPRRPKEARALARHLRAEKRETTRCPRCGSLLDEPGDMCELSFGDVAGGMLVLCRACCGRVRSLANVEAVLAFIAGK